MGGHPHPLLCIMLRQHKVVALRLLARHTRACKRPSTRCAPQQLQHSHHTRAQHEAGSDKAGSDKAGRQRQERQCKGQCSAAAAAVYSCCYYCASHSPPRSQPRLPASGAQICWNIMETHTQATQRHTTVLECSPTAHGPQPPRGRPRIPTLLLPPHDAPRHSTNTASACQPGQCVWLEPLDRG